MATYRTMVKETKPTSLHIVFGRILIWQKDEWICRNVTGQWVLIVPKIPSCVWVCVFWVLNDSHNDIRLWTIRKDAIVGQLMSKTLFRRRLLKRLTQKFWLEMLRYMIPLSMPNWFNCLNLWLVWFYHWLYSLLQFHVQQYFRNISRYSYCGRFRLYFISIVVILSVILTQ